ncbi:RICIN domain-containing protein [Actinoplanes palleronii]|uniref:Ricin B lectin domain-containing protein n=1 Tax=Actinoplanes palleronii TaxID=113570 RepID=A0ABQ4B1G8_9ACTN|nr:RICIN domain-containing protein [Actinoplanes palleronii]GIE64509.1 hypothetical protein Apa02nite_006170 [Actinoplanes palleronii]
MEPVKSPRIAPYLPPERTTVAGPPSPAAPFAWPRISDYWPDDAGRRRPPDGDERVSDAAGRPRSFRTRPAGDTVRSPLALTVVAVTMLLAAGFALVRLVQPNTGRSAPWPGAAALPRESPGPAAVTTLVASATANAGPSVTATSTHPSRRGTRPTVVTTAPPGPRTGPIVGVGGNCVDVPGGVTANGTPVQMWGCHESPQQRWTIGADGTIRALGKCLDVTDQGTANGTPIQLWDCNGSGGQAWVIESGSHLRNPQSGRYLDVPGGRRANGTGLQIYDGNTNAWQVWRLPT